MGSCLTLGNESSKKTHMLTKQETFLGRAAAVESPEGRGPQENCSATWPHSLGFMVVRSVSGLSLANHCDSGSFLVAHTLPSQDGCQREGFWEVEEHVVSPFDLSQTLLVDCG